MKFVVGESGEAGWWTTWRWRLVARNGRIMAVSGHSYSRKHDAMRAALRLMQRTEVKAVYLD